MELRRTTLAAVAVGVAALLQVPAPAAAGSSPVAGFRVDHVEHPAPGVVHEVHVRDRPEQVVHVTRVAPGAPVELRAVLSNDAVAEQPGLERTSAACARVGCVAAVNGDFVLPGTEQPLGAVVVDGEMARSPSPQHLQLRLGDDGRLSAGELAWSGQLMPTDLHALRIDGVNVGRGDGQLVLYTPRFGPTTATNPHGAEMTLRVVEPAGPLRLGRTARVEIGAVVDGGAGAIPPDGVVLSGHGAGADALRSLAARVADGRAGRHALLRLDAAGSVEESVGGAPVLVREGRRWVGNDGSPFVAGRHPRTVVGWTAAGETLLVTADGRVPGHSLGLSLPETADVLVALGATEAINLDGGGSTTHVVRGGVRNRPSDRLVDRGGAQPVVVPVPRTGEAVLGHVERPVVSVVAIVPRSSGPVVAHPIDPLAAPLHAVGPSVLAARAADPASSPDARVPALVVVPADVARTRSWPLLAAATGLLLTVAARLRTTLRSET